MRNLLKLILLCYCSYYITACSMSIEKTPPASLSDALYLGDGGISNFYDYQAPLPKKIGTLLRYENLEAHQSLEDAAKNYRILYTSTNGLDDQSSVVVSGSLFLPKGTPPKNGWPLILWAHGTVGIADICAPSWTGYLKFHREYLGKFLQQGYAIVATDYQGLGTKGTHPYLATRPEAYSSLDAIRAVQQANFPLAKKVIIMGQSQGAGAAVATSAYYKAYAPELDIRAVVATGVPYFTTESLLSVIEMRPQDKVDPMLGYNFYILSLLAMLDEDFKKSDYVKNSVMPTVNAVANTCYIDMSKRIIAEQLTYQKVFKKPVYRNLSKAFDSMSYPHLSLPVPVYVGTGMLDRDTPLKMQAAFVLKACQSGTVVQAHTYPSLAHKSVLMPSTQDSLPFMKKAFAGQHIKGNCQALPYNKTLK